MNTGLLTGIVVCTFILDFVYQLFKNKKRDLTFEQLRKLLAEEKYEEFEQLIESDDVKKRFPAFNVDFLKLNELMLKGDRKGIDEMFEHFNDVRLNNTQKQAVYNRAFYYYLSLGDEKKAREYYTQLSEINPKDQETLDIVYDIYIAKGYKYLDKLLGMAEKMDDKQKLANYPLIAEMYRNKGDDEKAVEYDKYISEFNEKLKNNT